MNTGLDDLPQTGILEQRLNGSPIEPRDERVRRKSLNSCVLMRMMDCPYALIVGSGNAGQIAVSGKNL